MSNLKKLNNSSLNNSINPATSDFLEGFTAKNMTVSKLLEFINKKFEMYEKKLE